MQKSTIFFGGLSVPEQEHIVQILPFTTGRLPVRYLGVPLITKKISVTECKPLIEKVRSRVQDWRNRVLSYAGRLQLIASVLSSMQVYWASVFILPKTVIKEINKLLKGFLWCQGELTKGKVKISWDNICKPKDQGGLGIKDLQLLKKTLWVKWINVEKLKGRSIWEVNQDSNSSIGWSNILRLREKVRNHVYYKIGNGKNVSTWFDKWCEVGPLSEYMLDPFPGCWDPTLDENDKDLIVIGQSTFIAKCLDYVSKNDSNMFIWILNIWLIHECWLMWIVDAMVHDDCYVLDESWVVVYEDETMAWTRIKVGYVNRRLVEKLINNGSWSWPEEWSDKFPVLNNIQIPILQNDVPDKVLWVTNSGNRTEFATKWVWKDLCDIGNKVLWKDVVWFLQSIPRHSFVLWMAVQDRLMTQDRIAIWKPNDDMKCVFCKLNQDSHEHLFFQCKYTKNVWIEMQKLMDKRFSFTWHSIIDEFSQLKANRSIWSIIRRLVLGATIYFIWQERNTRLFKNSERKGEVLIQNIMDSIKCRIMSFVVKETENIRAVETKWNVQLRRIRSRVTEDVEK
ncbi:reverse transcriptase zinc-binding domain-containing protein [Artemisia annua]|uniref:Reverse transcriptase zinc-binding domain-containing protein n=1 Tax=Artemisia annua TaxID=35608 RepID=A0A2U1NKF4_ARTAN|nr:reverse transcriptase zinc-binding domain-containing protein [Artemisia annua]